MANAKFQGIGTQSPLHDLRPQAGIPTGNHGRASGLPEESLEWPCPGRAFEYGEAGENEPKDKE